MLRIHSAALALAGALCWPWAGVSAAPMSLQEAIGRVLKSHPALRAENAASEALIQQAQLDSLRPMPTLGAELENFAGTGAVSGVHGAEATLRLGQVIELGGKREARSQRGEAIVARQQLEVARTWLDLATETTRRYIAVVESQMELALASDQVAKAGETRNAVDQRVQRGVVPEGEVTLAEIAVVRAELAREHAEHELASARFSLASLWGESGPADVEANGDFLTLPALPDFDALAARLVATPEAQAFDRDIARIEGDRRVARANATPDLSLTAGVRRLEALDDQALVLSFSMPFGTQQRSTHALARIDAEHDAVAARREAALLDARQQLFARYQELRHARTEFEALSGRMIPAAERGLALTRQGYDDARYSILQLTLAQSALLQLQLDRLAAAARYHTLLADIERSTTEAGATP